MNSVSYPLPTARSPQHGAPSGKLQKKLGLVSRIEWDKLLEDASTNLDQEIRNNPVVEVELQTTSLFQRALPEYVRHTDKKWSLTDCASISVMRSRALFEALTDDHHFEQAGFTILLKQE